jgi:hypothetical protein
MRRRLIWGDADDGRPSSRHPYRDMALVYLGFAVVIVVVATATGGDFVRAVVAAALFWLAATAYGLVSVRRRLRRRKLG